MRAVTGLDGLQLYASDHWVDYLFAATDVSSKTLSELPVYRLAVALAQQVDYMGKNHFLLEKNEASNIADDRLESLRDIQLRELARLTLESRYPKVLEAQIFLPAGPDGFSIKRDEVALRTAFQGALAAYQSIVRFLLQKSDYPGITSEDLNRFKHQLCQSAFTCRLGKCYFAIVGFESEKLRDEHEMTHGKPILCPSTGSNQEPWGVDGDDCKAFTIWLPPLATMRIGNVRVMVHKLRNNDWVDIGMGYCSVDTVPIENGLDETRVIVKSEVLPELTILDTVVVEARSFVKQNETLIGLTEAATGVDTALGFMESEACRTASTNFRLGVLG
ncbi:NACHT domain-containing protein [Seiridium cupressi]